MLGMAAPVARPQDKSPAPSSIPPPPGQPPRRRTAVTYDPSGGYRALVVPQKRTGSLLLIGVLALGFVGVVALGAWFAWQHFGAGPDIRARVLSTPAGDRLAIDVPGAAAGTKVRFAGSEKLLTTGRATLPLAADALHLGDNDLRVDVIGPDGAVHHGHVALTLDFRVRADLADLDRDPPAIGIVVDAAPGSHVLLDGKPIALDAHGHGRKAFALPPPADQTGPTLVQDVRYRIMPPHRPPADGHVRTEVPYASLQIDRPGIHVLTDHPNIEVAGAVAPGSRVTVDGRDAPVHEGRFAYQLSLAHTGTFKLVVVAHLTGHAPRTRILTVERVDDLAKAARAYKVDRTLTYARIAKNPNTYRGRRVGFVGRVYNVQVARGQSVLQILVRDCPHGERCPAWVTYSAATDANVNTWVHVLGTEAGQQQFRADSGDVVTVPRVDAAFVIPASP